MIHWMVRLRCDACNALIVIEDEQVRWRRRRPRKAEALQAARRWVEEHGNALPLSANLGGMIPSLVHWDTERGWHVLEPEQRRCLSCPACGGNAFPVEDARVQAEPVNPGALPPQSPSANHRT